MPNEVSNYGVNAAVAQGNTLQAGQSGVWPIVPAEVAESTPAPSPVVPEPAESVSIQKES